MKSIGKINLILLCMRTLYISFIFVLNNYKIIVNILFLFFKILLPY